jgi:hypothetical protein
MEKRGRIFSESAFRVAGAGHVLFGKKSIPSIQTEFQESESFSFLLNNGKSMSASLFEPSKVNLPSVLLKEQLSNGESLLLQNISLITEIILD